MRPALMAAQASARRGLPSVWPRAFAAARAAFVRWEIRARSFSARAAYRCSRNGSTSAPSSATRNGTRCAMRPLMKCTSRERRSNFATTTGALPCRRASASAAESCGRRSRASAPFPRLDLGELRDDLEALSLSEASDGCALGVETKAGLSLLASADLIIGDERLHFGCSALPPSLADSTVAEAFRRQPVLRQNHLRRGSGAGADGGGAAIGAARARRSALYRHTSLSSRSSSLS